MGMSLASTANAMTVTPSNGLDARLHMAGVLVYVTPQQLEAVSARILQLPGAALHAQSHGGKLVVTLESERSEDIVCALNEINRIPGVMSAALVSEHSEPLATIDEEISHDD